MEQGDWEIKYVVVAISISLNPNTGFHGSAAADQVTVSYIWSNESVGSEYVA